MAVSLELRSPFLDHRVVELGLALPPELASGKAALKRAFAADLPPEIAGRGKTGLRRPARPLVPRASCGRSPRTCCSAARTAASSGGAELERLLREHADGRADHGHRLWCLCMLELWQRNYVDVARPALVAA